MSRSWKRTLGVLAAIVLPLVLPLLVGVDILRWSGALYQLTGLATVVWGLNERPEAFGLSTIWGNVRRWLARVRDRILCRPQTIAPARFDNVSEFFGGRADAYSDASISGTTDKQLTAIKGWLSSLSHAVASIDQKIINLDKETKRLSARDRVERDKAVADLKSQAIKAALGNTGLDLLGVVLIAVGITLSTLAS